ncbi:hypothetical protein HanRHA438_Chr15g0688891 [Helianthus annuus]|nr:hypothetical protein HanRHA438_Chr15g0688891 [Helianthus annuus]
MISDFLLTLYLELILKIISIVTFFAISNNSRTPYTQNNSTHYNKPNHTTKHTKKTSKKTLPLCRL